MALKAIRNAAGHVIDFEWMLMNSSSEELFNLDHEKMAGKRLSKEMLLALAEKWVDMFSIVIDTGVPLNKEYYSDGLKKWLHLTGVKTRDVNFM